MSTVLRQQLPTPMLRIGMIILGNHGGVEIVEEEPRPSGVVTGTHIIYTDVGTLYLDSDTSALVEFDSEDYDHIPAELIDDTKEV